MTAALPAHTCCCRHSRGCPCCPGQHKRHGSMHHPSATPFSRSAHSSVSPASSPPSPCTQPLAAMTHLGCLRRLPAARMSPAPEAAAVAEPSLSVPAQYRPSSRPLMISHESRLLVLPAPQPHTCRLSAVMASSNTTSNAHWASPLLPAVSSHGHEGCQEPAQHATPIVDAVVHLTVVHSIKGNSSNHSSMTCSTTTSAVSSLNTASHGYSRAADSTASEPPTGNTQDSLHHCVQAAPTAGAAMCSSPCLTRPNSSSSVLCVMVECASNPSSSHGSHT